MRLQARFLLAAATFSAWLLFLLVGWAWGGAVHLLLVTSLALFPWRAARLDADRS